MKEVNKLENLFTPNEFRRFKCMTYLEQVVYLYNKIKDKQDKLISGENIKTINGESILGSGNIEIEGGGAIEYINIDGTSGILSDVKYQSIINTNKLCLLINSNEIYLPIYKNVNYITYLNIDSPVDNEVTFKTIYISTSGVNIKHWNKEDIIPNVSQFTNDAGYLTIDTLPVYEGGVI